MINIIGWNDGFETHDSRRTKGRLSWVRQNILLGDVIWAKLWLRPDAAQIWAGWTALIWCASQSETRGTVRSAEDVALLSRVPMEMVENALKWAFSSGLAELCVETAEACGDMRADCAHDVRDLCATSATTVHNITDKQDKQTDAPKPRAKARAPFDPKMFHGLIPVRFFSDQEVIDLWETFAQDRHDRKKGMTENAAKIILQKLDGYNLLVVKESLRKSISSGWQDVFPENVKVTVPQGSQKISLHADKPINSPFDSILKENGFL